MPVALKRNGSLKSTPIVNECSPSTGRQCSDTETSEPLIGKPLNPLISCAAGSPVKTLASPGKAPDSVENVAASGSSTPKRSTRSSRATSSSKMSPPFALADWIKYSGRSLRSGTMRSGIVYPHAPLAPLTGGIGSGLWPTPHSNCSTGAGTQGRQGGLNLQTAVKMLPTPSVCGNYNRKGASPTSGDGLATVAGGALNPNWVEWLMGYPIGWTDLKDSATPSSRKSRK